MSDSGQSVLVTGDFVQDRYIYEGQLRRSGSQIRLGTSSQETPGGAALLEALLRSLGGVCAEPVFGRVRFRYPQDHGLFGQGVLCDAPLPEVREGG